MLNSSSDPETNFHKPPRTIMTLAARPGRGSKSTLFAAEVASATFWLSSSSSATRRSEWLGVRKISRAWLPLDCLFNTQAPAFELVAVEFLNGVCSGSPLRELHEGKSSWTSGFTVGWYGYLYHLAHFRKKTFEFALRRIVTQISYKNFAANDVLLSGRLSTIAALRGLRY